MPQTKEQKKKILEELKEKIAKQKALFFVDFTGLKVKDITELKNNLKASGNEMKVAKKTLIGIALKEKNIDINPKEMAGEVALVFGFEDEISPAKNVYQFSQSNQNLRIIGGYVNNAFLAAESVIELAKLPSRQELLAKLARSISAPAYNFVSVLQGNIKGLVLALDAISKQNNKI